MALILNGWIMVEVSLLVVYGIIALHLDSRIGDGWFDPLHLALQSHNATYYHLQGKTSRSK